MKKNVLFLLFLAFFARVHSQCTPDFNITTVGFYPPDSLMPCIEEDLFYDEVIQFKNFSQVSGSVIGLPGVIVIVSVQIDSVKNLPPGITYTCNSPNCYYTTGENGCVRISGTTSAPPGVYDLGFYATLMVDFGFGTISYQADSQFLANNGLGYKLTVISQGGACPNKYSGQLYLNASLLTPAVCEGDTVPFHSLVSGGIPPYTYSWSPGTYLSDPGISDPLLLPTHPGIYTLTVTDNSGLSATDDVEVVYNSNPAVVISPDTSICPGDSVQLQASGGISYAWSPSAGLSETDVANPFASPSQATTYTVSVSNGLCSASADVTVAVDTVRPQASFNPIPSGFTVLFNNTSSGAGSFFWDFGDGSNSTQRNPQHQYTEQTVYEVSLIASNNCGFSDTVTVTVDLSVGIAAIDADAVRIYPNPVNDILLLSVNAGFGDNQACELISTKGQILKKEFFSSSIRMDLSALDKGVYILKVSSEKQVVFKKIILQ